MLGLKKITSSRRGFLRVMGIAPVAAPLAAKQIAEEQMASVMPVGKLVNGIGGMSGQNNDIWMGGNEERSWMETMRKVAIGIARDQVRSKLYEEEKDVDKLDIDIANKRSFSMAAKIAYQRQRNVERRLRQMETMDTGYNQVNDFIKKFVGWKDKK